MRAFRCFAVVVIGLALVSFAASQDRDELLATPKAKEDAKVPSFADLTAEQVAEQIGNTEGGHKNVGGHRRTKVVGHRLLPNQTQNPGEGGGTGDFPGRPDKRAFLDLTG